MMSLLWHISAKVDNSSAMGLTDVEAHPILCATATETAEFSIFRKSVIVIYLCNKVIHPLIKSLYNVI